MPARVCALLLPLSLLAGASLGFAPAPVYKPPKEANFLTRMQGTWKLRREARVLQDGKPALSRSLLVSIKGDRWAYIFDTNGTRSEGTPVQIILDAKQNPVAIDLKLFKFDPGVNPYSMRGIIKVEGDLLSVCYSPGTFASRPAKFARRQSKWGEDADKDVSPTTMTFTRVK